MDALGGTLVGVGPPTLQSEHAQGPSTTTSSSSSDSSTCSGSESYSGTGGDSTFFVDASKSVRGDGELESASTEQCNLADRLQRERLRQLQQGETAVLAHATALAAGATWWPRRSTGWLTPLQAAQIRLLIAALPYAHFQRSATALASEPEPEPELEQQSRPCAALLLRDMDVAESVGLLIVGCSPLCFTRAHWAIDTGAIAAVHPWRKPNSSRVGDDSAAPMQPACAGTPVASMRGECAGTSGATAMVDEIMVAGIHFAEIKLHSGSQMTFGVVLPTYAPPDTDLPSEPDAQEGEEGGTNGDWRQAAGGASDHTLSASDTKNGWVVEADTGDAMHDGQYGEWETGTPVGFAAGDTVGLLLQLTSSSNGWSTARLTLYKNGQRRGVPFDGLHSDAGFSWVVELCDCGDCVSILRRPPPLGPDGLPLQHYSFERCSSTSSGADDVAWRGTRSARPNPRILSCTDSCSPPRGNGNGGKTTLQQLQDAPFEAVSEQAVEALRGQPHAEHELVRQPRAA